MGLRSLLSRTEIQTREVRADQLTVGMKLAPGRYQEFILANVHRHGEVVQDVDTVTHGEDDKVTTYVYGDSPHWVWCLEPNQAVQIVTD